MRRYEDCVRIVREWLQERAGGQRENGSSTVQEQSGSGVSAVRARLREGPRTAQVWYKNRRHEDCTMKARELHEDGRYEDVTTTAREGRPKVGSRLVQRAQHEGDAKTLRVQHGEGGARTAQ